jgi:hypothetical protein
MLKDERIIETFQYTDKGIDLIRHAENYMEV